MWLRIFNLHVWFSLRIVLSLSYNHTIHGWGDVKQISGSNQQGSLVKLTTDGSVKPGTE